MNKKMTFIATLLLAALLFTACGGNTTGADSQAVSLTPQSVASTPAESSQSEPEGYTPPVDFAALQEQNPEIYAWIRVPGTTIDYPIVQSMEGDEYYLRRNIDREDALEGSLFTQVTFNSQTFADPHTVIYGHNMTDYGDTMFTDVRKYDSREYFDEHRDVYIYTPEKELHYKVFAAYIWNDEHLLYTYQCRVPEVFQNYLDMVMANKDLKAVIDTDMQLTSEDKILTLSTCESNESYDRFLVQAVLQ